MIHFVTKEGLGDGRGYTRLRELFCSFTIITITLGGDSVNGGHIHSGGNENRFSIK